MRIEALTPFSWTGNLTQNELAGRLTAITAVALIALVALVRYLQRPPTPPAPKEKDVAVVKAAVDKIPATEPARSIKADLMQLNEKFEVLLLDLTQLSKRTEVEEALDQFH